MHYKWNIDTRQKHVVSVILNVSLVMLLVVTASHIPWFLSNNKIAYAALSNAPISINVRTPYPTLTSIRLTNKLSAAATTTSITTSPSASLSSKALPSMTRSLSSIVTKVKERNDNNIIGSSNNLTKSHNSSFLPSTNHYIISKSNVTKSSVLQNGVNDNDTDIAFIKPSFTAAAYDHSFYVFYTLYKNTPQGTNITTDLNLLTGKVTSQTTDSSPSAFAMYYLSIALRRRL